MSISEDRRRILSMLAEGKISPDDADRLLDALGAQEPASAQSEGASPRRGPGAFFGQRFAQFGFGPSPRAAEPSGFDASLRHDGPSFLHIEVDDPSDDKAPRVDIRVPLNMVRAGIVAGSFMPPFGTEHAFGHPTRARIEEMLKVLADLKIDVAQDGRNVRMYCD